MKKRRARTAACVYCGALATTRDHVPPLAFFPDPLPENLITVASCERCNKEYGRHDEYVRDVMMMRADFANASLAQPLLERMQRAWSRPQSEVMRRGHLASMFEVPVRTPAGLYAGTRPAFRPDWDRLEKFATRVMRGLYAHELGTRLSLRTRVKVHLLENDPDLLAHALETIGGRPVNERGGDAFRWSWQWVRGDTQTTCWILEFYQRMQFLVLSLVEDATMPPTPK